MIVGSIPECLEHEPLSCLEARTAVLSSFRSLGPADLVQLTKGKDTSTYHFVTGVNTSSSAAIAAHLNTLTFSLGESQVWFGRHPQWKISAGVYCTWNAFSDLDVRVSAKIPGSIDVDCFDVRGQEQDLNDQLWLETYMSAMVRSLVLADSDEYYTPCCRHENPISTKRDALQFLSAFSKLFARGAGLGSANSHTGSLCENYMVDALFRVLEVTSLYPQALEMLHSLADRYPQARVLVARTQLLANQEVDAISYMVEAVRKDPMEAYLLSEEAKVMLDKDRPDLALDCAVRATASLPSSVFPWTTLARVYIALGQYNQALLALNSCPILMNQPMDQHRMPEPRKVHSPLPSDGVLDEVWAVENTEEHVDPSLLRLSGNALKGVPLQVYKLLAKILAKVGWLKLMDIRGSVFLMEEETKEKPVVSQAVPQAASPKSTDGVKSPRSSLGQENEETQENKETEKENEETQENEETEKENQNENQKDNQKASDPAQNDKEATDTPHNESSQHVPPANGSVERHSLRAKRLCETKLDALFMVLYGDVRVFNNWQRELIHFESQKLPYMKTAYEWELLGAVAQRLENDEQAKYAFQRSLEARFSHRVLWKLLEYYAPVGKPIVDSDKALEAVAKLMAWNHRWYREFSPRLLKVLSDLVALEGLTKVKNQFEARYGKMGVIKVLNMALTSLADFGGAGFDM